MVADVQIKGTIVGRGEQCRMVALLVQKPSFNIRSLLPGPHECRGPLRAVYELGCLQGNVKVGLTRFCGACSLVG